MVNCEALSFLRWLGEPYSEQNIAILWIIKWVFTDLAVVFTTRPLVVLDRDLQYLQIASLGIESRDYIK